MHHKLVTIALLTAIAGATAPIGAIADDADTTQATDCQAPRTTADGKLVQTERPASRTATLADCSGVLQPPSVDDKELVQPAPATGTMPVIKPQQMPEQN